ncbi:MAG: ATP-dependent DNA helicase [Lachnospiraceae bacterium]|nr:ATP-dependent DNA helicase [Lachnospiraceae bacterium]
MVPQIHISVRGLVEFIMRSGDIDRRRNTGSGPEVMLEGANIHRMIQRRMGKSYHAEVYLKCIIRRGDADIIIDGRADGIIIPSCFDDRILFSEDDDKKTAKLDEPEGSQEPFELTVGGQIDQARHVIIDEIKTTYRELERIREPEKVHMAQALCYAYMVSDMADLPEIGVRITYCNTETKEVRYFDSLYKREEITAWFRGLIKSYVRWADFETGWKKIRNMSIETLDFPYPYRSGQRELVAQVYSSISKRERLFVMAPTGVGKTLANVYPSLKSFPEDKAEKIFYLTAKTITRTVAADCLKVLREGGLKLKSVVLTAKEKICPLDKCECNPDACPYAKGHYDRINDAMYDLLIGEDDFSREKIREYSDKHMVCPFEFSLDMSLFSDMIICDYNYVFDPNVYLRRFFGDSASGSFLFLIDEAHNLAERAMKMYSAKLVKEHFLDIKRLVKDTDPYLARSLESCNRHLLTLKRECENNVKVVDSFDPFVNLLLRLNGRIEQFLDDHDRFAHTDELLEFYFELRHFLNIYENMNEKDYVTYTKLEDNGDFAAHLMCANPAKRVRACTDRARATVFFSATLIPIGYYRMMLGADEEDPAVYARSVFDPANRALLVARDVTSKYTRRGESEYDKMARYIFAMTQARCGNYMVFFPSFAMLENVYDLYMSRYFAPEDQEVIIQSASMSEADREDFLSRFAEQNDDTLIGFCVLGGIFSEGIDLKNDALIGAIIVGTGLPMVCAERDLMKRCYDEMGLDGFAYAYRYPGMNKVLQAAGRVIRTEEDRGVVALLDERFLGRDYLRLFPREWEDYHICRVDDIAESLEIFWNPNGLIV